MMISYPQHVIMFVPTETSCNKIDYRQPKMLGKIFAQNVKTYMAFNIHSPSFRRQYPKVTLWSHSGWCILKDAMNDATSETVSDVALNLKNRIALESLPARKESPKT
eukprot:2083384-Amphidinium_carterae.1